MKNEYLKNLTKIEFVITDACTGKCKHCSAGDHALSGAHIDPAVAADAVRKVTAEYGIQTVMCFGGEPLLYPEAVYAVMQAARDAGVARRQVITNGYFSRDMAYIRAVAERLARSGANQLLLSVDAFHQETIPLSVVQCFAEELLRCGVPLLLSPAWLVSVADENPFNQKTRAILDSLAHLQIPVGEGNVVFPEGNARRYLAAYFSEVCPENPYIEDPYALRCLSVSANGDLLSGNLYRRDVMEIIKEYAP